jgi:hypothetical protein
MQKLSLFLHLMHLGIDALSTTLSENYIFYHRCELAIVLAAGVYGCHAQIHNYSRQNVNTNATPIGQIQSLPYPESAAVDIEAKVVKQVPLLHQKAYLVSDNTGKIWVVTYHSNWQVGQEVVFKGKVKYSTIFLPGKKYRETYLAAK